ncbi:hypothetical protein [Pyxidicoccus sp. MSG2]|uniref:hypothetical protein n=1 Tax=Pyxidicoccus sp. MSG2 TaxID=2996790 RepID=UPI00227217F5|nr:hypothetical protein [Pyxidicoccus sp. MSG2]MCY1022541.1 hypothetical protein [Pyxidicoccus sp. MSG2]
MSPRRGTRGTQRLALMSAGLRFAVGLRAGGKGVALLEHESRGLVRPAQILREPGREVQPVRRLEVVIGWIQGLEGAREGRRAAQVEARS